MWGRECLANRPPIDHWSKSLKKDMPMRSPTTDIKKAAGLATPPSPGVGMPSAFRTAFARMGGGGGTRCGGASTHRRGSRRARPYDEARGGWEGWHGGGGLVGI